MKIRNARYDGAVMLTHRDGAPPRPAPSLIEVATEEVPVHRTLRPECDGQEALPVHG